jgi:uncharacterized protein (DUF305 family)
MKSVVSMFKDMQAFSFLIGTVLGAVIGLGLFCYLVPHGPSAIRMFQHYQAQMKGQEKRNREAFVALYASTSMQMPGMNHSTSSSDNPYIINPITSEKQFLEDMTLHHEAAVLMANQVLTLQSIHPEIKKLANDIIRTQTTEIKIMKDWITKWK